MTQMFKFKSALNKKVECLFKNRLKWLFIIYKNKHVTSYETYTHRETQTDATP